MGEGKKNRMLSDLDAKSCTINPAPFHYEKNSPELKGCEIFNIIFKKLGAFHTWGSRVTVYFT